MSSTLEYLDEGGSLWYAKIPFKKLNAWLSSLNGDTNVGEKAPTGANRGKIIAELEARRSKTRRSFVDRVANLTVDYGRAEDWREYENSEGYTHLEELLIFQPREWKKQAREYFYRYNCRLDRESENEERSLEWPRESGMFIFMKEPVLVVLFHPGMSRQSRYQPLNFLLAYGISNPLPKLEEDLDESQKTMFRKELSPLEYFFDFEEKSETYRLDMLQKIGAENSSGRLALIKELDFSDVVGQRLAKQVIRSEMVKYVLNRGARKGIGSSRQPLSMVFAGPSGIGKTELASWLAKLLNKPDDEAFHKVDCGKMREGIELFGMSGAHQGSKEGSALNNFILRMSQDEASLGIVLLDEIEKAERSVIHGLYQVLDKGEWTNKQLKEGGGSQTEIISCENIIFIMTTNAADIIISDYAARHEGLYTASGEQMDQLSLELETLVQNKLQRTPPFTNAFMGRVCRVVPFIPMAVGDPDEWDSLLCESFTAAKILIEREQDKIKKIICGDTRISSVAKHDIAKIAVKASVAENGVRGIQKRVEALVGERVTHSLLLERAGISEGSIIRFSAHEPELKVDFRAEDKDTDFEEKATSSDAQKCFDDIIA